MQKQSLSHSLSFNFSSSSSKLARDHQQPDSPRSIHESEKSSFRFQSPFDHNADADFSEDDDDYFEFSIVYKDSNNSPVSAKEIFSEGQIKSIYYPDLVLNPTGKEEADLANKSMNRMPLSKLFDGEQKSTSNTSIGTTRMEEKPSRCKKSNSTGACKRWRFKDFICRSNNNGELEYMNKKMESHNVAGRNKPAQSMIVQAYLPYLM